MKVKSKLTWACVLGFAGMTGMASVLAAADNTPAEANPYSLISDRNVFHLNPAPPPEPPPEPKPVDLPKVMLTGFVGKGSSMRVYLAIPPKDSKENTFYTGGLLPGDKEHDVELVKINYDKKEVEIMNSGTPQTLSVKSNSYLATATAPAAGGKGAGAPGMPAGIGLRRQPPGFPSRNLPQPAAPPPAPGSASTGGGGGSSAIVVGGGGGDSSAIVSGGGSGNSGSALAAYNSSSSPIVSGGSSYGAAGTPAAANNLGNQLANALANTQTGQTGNSHPGKSSGPVAPLPVQAAAMVIQNAQSGGTGPPLLPSIQEAVDGMDGPPMPP